MPTAQLPPGRRLQSGRGIPGSASALPIPARGQKYDSNAIRSQVEERCAMPNILPQAIGKWKNCFSPFLYRTRNAH